MRSVRALLLICPLLAATTVQAHDPSAYGGLFRTRDFGASWLNADVGLFLGGALSLTIDPIDSNHLLMGTDTGVMRSRNGGRAWITEDPGKLFGAAFAVTFLPEASAALCVTPGGVFRFDGGQWQQAAAPAEAAPGRAFALGAAAGQVYLIGRREPYASADGGRTWMRIEHDLPGQPEFTALVVVPAPVETLLAIVDDAVMASRDAGRTWRAAGTGLPAGGVEGLSVDPAHPARLWIASAAQIYSSADGGARWQAVGVPLPEAGTSVRAVAADADGRTLVVATHRGLYRSADAAQSWTFLEGNLPVHLEARPLVRDPAHVQTLYAGYSLMPYAELWRRALEGGSLLSRVDPISLAGGLAFLALLVIAGVLAARALFRRRSAVSIPLQGPVK